MNLKLAFAFLSVIVPTSGRNLRADNMQVSNIALKFVMYTSQFNYVHTADLIQCTSEITRFRWDESPG